MLCTLGIHVFLFNANNFEVDFILIIGDEANSVRFIIDSRSMC